MGRQIKRKSATPKDGIAFTKSDMLTELKTIFLYEADHIYLGAGGEMAAAFIGFELDEEDNHCFENPDKVDLTRFSIRSTFESAYDYAFFPSVLNQIGDDEMQNLIVFMEGIPHVGGASAGGEQHEFMELHGKCRTVCDTSFARWKLYGHGGGFSTRELALLANMTEGAVRNALADRGENGLRAIPNTKNPVMVDDAEAERWLRGRRGFVPTPDRPRADRFITDELKNLQSAKALGDLVRRLSWRLQPASDGIAWNQAEIDQWIKGTQTFDLERAMTLATALDLDEALFASKALEITLRRDRTPAEGELA